MGAMRTGAGAGAAVLSFMLLLPAPAASQQPDATRIPDATTGSTDSEAYVTTTRVRRSGASSLSRCDPANVHLESSLKSTVFPYYLMDCVSSYSPVDGDWGPDGPDPSSPRSYLYPDTRFDLAAAVQQLQAKRGAKPEPRAASAGGAASSSLPIPPVREPSGEANAMRTVQLPVRTEPVVTRQIMEQRILQGKIQRGEIEVRSRSDIESDRYDGSETPRPTARRTVRSQPAANRPAAPARTSTSRSASSPSSTGQSQPKGRRGSTAASSPES